jgi:hypothetical protein
MYLALDSGLPAGGSMVVDLTNLPATTMSACKLWPLTTSLDASTLLDADMVSADGIMAQPSGSVYTCQWTVDL